MYLLFTFRSNNALEGQAIDLSIQFQALSFEWSDLRLQIFKTLVTFSLEDRIMAITPAG
jgi:hypothetical protein